MIPTNERMKRTFTVNFGAIDNLQVLGIKTEFVESFNFLRVVAKLDLSHGRLALCVRAFCHEYAFFEGSRREFFNFVWGVPVGGI